MSREIIVISENMRTTSMQVAKTFGKTHAHVLIAVRSLPTNTTEVREFNRANYGAIFYTDSMGRTQEGVEMTRDGFAILAMGFTGIKAMEWKLKYLAAFNAMEAALAKDNDKLEWKVARSQITQVRKSFTNTVATFVDYATAQGSKSAKMYYMNLTKMEYAALDLLDRQKSALGNFRDTLDVLDLSFLTTAEVIAKGAIEQGMQQEMHYKEIYQFAKQKVTDYAKSVSFLKIGEKD
jgi:Rha family phage regulatory protein